MGVVRSNSSLKHERRHKNDIIDNNEVFDATIIEKNVEEDVIAVFARYTKDLLLIITTMIGKFQKSSCYTVLARTTQPAHFVTAVSVLFVAHLCIARKDPVNVSPICTLVYLGSFSVHLGAQIWMTFVSGLSLYFSIPRHTFGNVQQVLFPKYFLLNAVLSLITLTLFLKSQNQIITNLQTSMQVLAMVVCFLIELIIRLYFTPPLIELIRDKNQKEEEAGVGKEIGRFNPGTLMNDSVYLEIHIRFRKLHKVIAIGNIITMGCTMLHLYYLSQRIIIM